MMNKQPKNEGGRPSETGSPENPVLTLAEVGIDQMQKALNNMLDGMEEE